jgi:PAS domain S-box-containing protein
MQWQSCPYTLPLFVNGLVCVALAGFFWRRRTLLGATAGVWAMLGAAVWAFGRALSSASADLSGQFFWHRVVGVGSMVCCLSFVAFAVEYHGGTPLSGRRFAWLLPPAVIFFVLDWTNEWHQWMWKPFLDYSNGFAVLVARFGPAGMLWIGYQYALVLLGALFLLQRFLRSHRYFSGQIIAVAVAVGIPAVVESLWVLNIGPLGPMEPAPFGFAISGIALAAGVFRYRLGEITPAAREAIIENMSDALFVLDDADRVVDCNPAALRFAGRGASSAVGLPIAQLLPVWSELIGETAAEAHRMVDVTLPVPSGGERSYEIRVSPVQRKGGEVAGRIVLLHDITERKRAEQELHQAKATAEAASQAKGAFLATVSHELRTPLTSVLGFAKLIKRRLSEVVLPALAGADAKVEHAVRQVSDNVDIIVAEGERLTTLINDVLDLAKIESGKVEWHMQPVAVGEIIARAIAATTSLSGAKGLAVRTEINDALPSVVGDPDRLIQVVINLLSNAIKFTDDGAITCRARRVDGAIEVSVTDTGAGIEPEDQGKVFEQFVQVGDTLTGKPTGTGLGLPICKQIIEHHGGCIWVKSEVGRGSTFAFTLPAGGTAAEPGPTMLAPPRIELAQLVAQLKHRVATIGPANGRPRTVLIVDDDPSIRALLRQELEAAGHPVREAATGEEALVAVKQERPGLIILDVMMPGLSGFDVAAVLRNDPQTLDIPIIILSVLQDQERGLRLGVDRYFTKPVSTEVLLQEVDALLARGPSKKKVLVVDEDAATVQTLSAALQAQGYSVVSATSGPDAITRAVADQPDLVLVRSALSEQHQVVQTVRFTKGMEMVSFLLFE